VRRVGDDFAEDIVYRAQLSERIAELDREADRQFGAILVHRSVSK
jgi:hypothetical protein